VGRAAPVHELPVGTAPAASLALLIGLLGALAGVGLAVVTDAVSRSDVGGASWALVVPLSSAPAILVAGWVSLARLRVRDRQWGRAGMIAGSVMFLIGALTGMGPVLAVNALGQQVLSGTGDSSSTAAVLTLTFGLPVALALVSGLALATAFARLNRRAVAYAIGMLIAALGLLVSVPGGFFLYGPAIVLPLLVGLPTVVGSEASGQPLIGRLWLAAACVALPTGLVAGLLLAEKIQGR
jgi:hypothetical protein